MKFNCIFFFRILSVFFWSHDFDSAEEIELGKIRLGSKSIKRLKSIKVPVMWKGSGPKPFPFLSKVKSILMRHLSSK